ncbi:flagellar assembly protein FliW [Jeotgalibacillus marinus]
MQTKYHGTIELEEKSMITFEEGIPGFPDAKSFVLLPLQQDAAFTVLQSTEEPTLAFILVNPFEFKPDYEVNLPDKVVGKLAITEPDEVAIFTILTVQSPFENTTANLQAPVVINIEKQQAKQLILTDSPYTPKHHLFKQRNSPNRRESNARSTT